MFVRSFLAGAMIVGMVLGAGSAGATTSTPSADPGTTLLGYEDLEGKILQEQFHNPCIFSAKNCEHADKQFGYVDIASGDPVNADSLGYTVTTILDRVNAGEDGIIGTADDTNATTVNVGVDINQEGSDPSWSDFVFQVFVNGSEVYSFLVDTVNGDILNNGTGWADFLLTGIDLSGFNDTDIVTFHLEYGNNNDGPDQFILTAGEGVPVPEPASLALVGTGLVGLGAFGRRRLRQWLRPAGSQAG